MTHEQYQQLRHNAYNYNVSISHEYPYGCPCAVCSAETEREYAEMAAADVEEEAQLAAISVEEIAEALVLQRVFRPELVREVAPAPPKKVGGLVWLRCDPMVALGLATGGEIEVVRY